MTPSFDPIAPWPIIALAAVVIVGLTLWAYRKKLRGTSGRWRWVALGLRMAAVALCVLAALRPSLLILKKEKQAATVLFLEDISSSMDLGGEAGGQSRFQAAEKALKQGREAVKSLGSDVSAKTLLFDSTLREPKADEKVEAKGRLSALGDALEEAVKRYEQTKILRVVLLSDGASNTGADPRAIAQSLRNRNIPVVTVGFGSESAGSGTKDIAVRDLEAGPIVYAKTELEVFTRLDVRGYASETLDVELWTEHNRVEPVARTRVRVPPGVTEVPVRNLKWTPETPGETKVTLKVKPMPGELIKNNNETSTFVTVLKGGISVLYVHGPSSPWEKKFVERALDASEKIQSKLVVLFGPAGRDLDVELSSGLYDVFILGDVPAEFLSRGQQQLLAHAVERGAGLVMLGGRNSFGSGGWTSSPLADLLPVEMHPGDGQVEPDSGLRVVPNPLGLDSYVLRLARTRAANEQTWKELPPIGGINQFRVKPAARLWALSDRGEPVIAALEIGRARTLAVAGETWPWARYSESSRLAHLNFWRNTILWLAHKEDEGETQVHLKLDRRRVALGQRLDLEARAEDEKGEPIDGVRFEASITPLDKAGAKPEGLPLFDQGKSSRASYYATGEPADYKVEVTATKGGQTIGTASARFLVYDDDRELRNPAADLTLLRAIARESGGHFLRPEELDQHLRSLGREVIPDYVTQREERLWDTWPFLLLFTALLTAEWWLRKRHGWV